MVQSDRLWYAKMIRPYPLADYFPVTLYFSLLLWCVSSVMRIPLYPYNRWLSLTSGLPGHSAWGHAPLTRPLGHFHHKPSCSPAQHKLMHRIRHSTWRVMRQGNQMLVLMKKLTTSASAVFIFFVWTFWKSALLNWQMKQDHIIQTTGGKLENSINQVFCLHGPNGQSDELFLLHYFLLE